MLCVLGEHAIRDGHKVKTFMAGARITCAQFVGAKLTLRDSFAIAPLALEKFAGLSGDAKTSTGLPCRCDARTPKHPKGCGGYCSIRRNMSPADYAKTSDYMENDCRVLYNALNEWISFLDEKLGAAKGTIGASSFAFSGQEAANWQAIKDPDNPLSQSYGTAIYNFSRKAYYGGRTECYRQLSPFGYHDDINSAYVDALRLAMPMGTPTRSNDRPIKGAKFYIAECSVSVPHSLHIPPLPIRRENRLFFPTGDIYGVWNSLELESAERAGCKIKAIGRVVSWDAMDTPYADYCNTVWNLRAAAGKDTVKGKLLKQLSVSLAGKLAQRPEHKEVVYNPNVMEMIGWTSIGKSTKWWYQESFKIPNCAHVHHAGVMTAYVRARMGDRARIHSDSSVYMDTDGLFCEKEIKEGQGKELGQFLPSLAEKGHDGTYRDFQCLAPKLYNYTEMEPEFRAKGFQLGKTNVAERYESIIAGESVELNRGVYPLLTALKRRDKLFEKRGKDNIENPLFIRRGETRQFRQRESAWIGARLKDGEIRTRPPTIGEVNQVTRERIDERYTRDAA